jgi:hypothetical protein
MVICSVCGVEFIPIGRWKDDWCSDCAVNFAASQELRVEEAVSLTPRERAAIELLQRAQARREDT